MHDFAGLSLWVWLGDAMRLDRLSDMSVLALGILVGLIAKNIYTIAMRSFGFVGSFASRLALGWWEEYRRETPNVLDIAMVVVADCDGQSMLLLDPLVAPRRLNDIYLNPRTAFGIRVQTFTVTPERPWVMFHRETRPGAIVRFRRWRRALLRPGASKVLTPDERWRLKYRRVYAPIETMVGQYLTNQWAAQMAIGEPCHVFRFIIALVYETSTDSHIDRHFHALVIWEDLLRSADFDRVMSYQPELASRWDTIRRIGAHYRSAPEAAAEFGSIHIMVPKRTLVKDYAVSWLPGAEGLLMPVSQPPEDRAERLMHSLSSPSPPA